MSEPASTQPKILPLLLLSGFCALSYEVIWAKSLSLTLGSSINAISIVTATFMVGLALGSFTFGRMADRSASPLKLYALLEGGIFLFALTFPQMLEFSETLYVQLHHQLPDSPGITTGIRLALAALLLLPPTVLMGGTLPAMARFHTRKKLSASLGRMYAINTFGGVLGCFLGGFFLIPSIGLQGTNHLALLVNAILCAAAFVLARQLGPQPKENTPPASEMTVDAPAIRMSMPFIAIAGALSLALQILWTRLLILMLGNTTYAFSSILSVFLLGLAIGGWFYAWLLRRGIPPRAIFFWSLLFASSFILVTHSFYDQLAHLFLTAHLLAEGHWWLLSQFNLVIVSMVLLPPTMAFGAIFPAGIALLAPKAQGCSQAVGLALFCNTFGAVTGSLMAGFLLLPFLGLHDSFHVCILIALGASLCFLLVMRPAISRRRTTALALALLIVGLLPLPWDQALINSGVYVYNNSYNSKGGIEAGSRTWKILDVIEGKETTVAVMENPQGFRFFRVNGKTDGGTGGDMLNQALAGQLPMLLHPDPENALVIGLGTGVTFGEVLTHPIRSADCIEISPEVVKSAKYFKDHNYDVLNDPRGRLHVKDGRNYLLTTQDRFDVIISEPSNPWQVGNANLFTLEYYELVSQHLKPGGIFCQWMSMYELKTEELAAAFKTFAGQFAHIRVFRIGQDVLMLSSHTAIKFDKDLVASRMGQEQVGRSLRRFGLKTPSDLLQRHYYCNGTTLAAFSENARLNLDRRPVLEYAKVFGQSQFRQNIAALENTRQMLGVSAID